MWKRWTRARTSPSSFEEVEKADACHCDRTELEIEFELNLKTRISRQNAE
jgi:hypothetical protein